MKKIAIPIVLLLCMLTTGCRSIDKPAQIVTTTLPIYEFTSEICEGTNITVKKLITQDVSCVHDYTLNVDQLRIIESAELVICNGMGLDTFVEDILPANKSIIQIAENPHTEENHHDHHNHHDHSEHDPHIWLDPNEALEMCQIIYQGLTEYYPEHHDLFAKNLAALNEKLESLDTYGKEQLSSLSCRKIITFHDGFSYLAEAYDLKILKAIEEEAGSEASAAQLRDLITLVQENDLKAIFTEKNGSASAAEIIARETGAKIFTLDMAISGESYFDAMYHNIDTLKEALG